MASSQIIVLLLGLVAQTLVGGFLGGLLLRALAARIVKIDLPLRQSWLIELGATFVSLALVTIISLLTSLSSSGIGLRLLVGFPITLICRSFIYTQVLEVKEGRTIAFIDAIALAGAVAVCAVAISLVLGVFVGVLFSGLLILTK